MAAAAGAGLAAAIALAAALLVQQLGRREIADGTANLATYATMLSAHLESSFTVLEAVQGGVLEVFRSHKVESEQEFTGLASTLAMHDLLAARMAAMRYVGGMTLIDGRGRLVNSTYYWPMPERDLSDREYFRVLGARDGPDRFVTKPLRNRATGEWTIYVARRVTSPGGTLLGILLGEINFSYFQDFFAQVAPEADAVTSMFDLEGVILVRQPAVEGVVGTAPGTGAFRLLANGVDHGTTRNVSPIDGKDRIIAVHRLSHYPLVLSLSRSVDAVLRRWRDQRLTIVAASGLLELALAISVGLALRHLKGRERLAELRASLAKAEIDRAVAAESTRFDVAATAMAEGERRAAKRQLADRFEGTVGGIIAAVGAAAAELRSTARDMAAIANRTASQTTSIAGAAADAATNVGSAAVAAEELRTSAQEIGSRVSGSAGLAQVAVAEAAQTTVLVQQLSTAADKIGDIVGLIATIAGQTNLLALNAAIEAARAGEAGRGFAVVAAEVKALATETERATHEISGQIGAIRDATDHAVTAIGGIRARIEEISAASNAVLASVERQGTTTEGIVDSVGSAAASAGAMTADLTGVAGSAHETGRSAAQVLDATSDLARQAEHLGAEVAGFLVSIRAA